MARKPDDTVHLKLRLPERLRAFIEKQADKRGVSMNTEIIDRLGHSYAAIKDLNAEITKAKILEIADELRGSKATPMESLEKELERLREESNAKFLALQASFQSTLRLIDEKLAGAPAPMPPRSEQAEPAKGRKS